MKQGFYCSIFFLTLVLQGQGHSSLMANVPAVVTQKPGDITLLMTDYKQVNFLLEKTLGKDLLYRQLNLHKLKELATAGKEVRNRIRFTLKKDVYSLLPEDMENLKTLYQAVNVPQPLLSKSVFQSTAKDLSSSVKDQLNKALQNILSFAPLASKIPVRSVPAPSLNLDALMQPFIEEKNSFTLGLGSSNQLTPAAVCFVDPTFFQQTGGNQTARNKGTLKLLLLAKAQLLEKKKIKALSPDQREQLAENLFSQETGGAAVVNNEKIYQIYDQARHQILKKVTPQLNCSLIRRHLGIE